MILFKDLIYMLLSLVVSHLFFDYGWQKIGHFEDFQTTIETYQIVGKELAFLAAFTLPFIEVALSVLLAICTLLNAMTVFQKRKNQLLSKSVTYHTLLEMNSKAFNYIFQSIVVLLLVFTCFLIRGIILGMDHCGCGDIDTNWISIMSQWLWFWYSQEVYPSIEPSILRNMITLFIMFLYYQYWKTNIRLTLEIK